uniref:Uncharacterized protein n=1 Tax=viral metagenome TaxID=1070528 RepID=A0A6M3LMF5_9ZZZZ
MRTTKNGTPDRRLKANNPDASERGRKAALKYSSRQQARKAVNESILKVGAKALKLLAKHEATIGKKATALLCAYYGDVRPSQRA